MDAASPFPSCPSAEDPRLGELERALRLLRGGADPAGIAEALSRRLTNKLLHAPTKAIQD